MKQLNLPRKYTLASQLWISVALIVLAAIFAFTPILSIDLSESKARDMLNDSLDGLNDAIDEDVDFTIPKKVDVTMPKLVTSIGVFTKVVGAVADAAKAASDSDDAKVDKSAEELQEILTSKDGQETIIMVMGLLMGTMDTDTDDNASETETTIGAIANGLLSYGILFYLLGITLIWPIILIITAIVTLIKAIAAWKKGENVASKFGAGLIGAFGMVVTVSLLMAFVPHMVLGSGMTVILILSIISIVVNVAVSRLRAYNELDFKYVNIVQGTALLKLIGFIVFFTNVLKTGFLRSFVDSMSAYLETALKQIDLLDAMGVDDVTMNFGYVIDMILIFVAAIFALGVCVAVAKSTASQLGLVAKKKVAMPGSLANGILALIACILPVVASKLENKIYYTLDDGEVVKESFGSIFSISDDGKSALVGMFIGAALILAADIAFIVTKKTFCDGITKEQEDLVLTGNAPLVIEAAAEEAVVDTAPVAEEPAEEAVAEEAPVEDAPVEDTPVEDTPAEDAPVEDTPVEDAPVEDAPVEDAPVEDAPVEDAPAEQTDAE